MPYAPVSPSSLWWQDRPVRAMSEPLREQITADVAVVGGGIVGVTLAADLAAAGKDVVLLESGRVGSGATGHTTGKATALQSPRYAELTATHGADAAAAFARLSAAAVERIRSDADRFGHDSAEVRPALTWTHRRQAVQMVEAEGRAARAAGLPVTDVDGHGRLPLVHGLRLGGQLQLDAVAHLRGLLASGLQDGLRLYESTPVTGVSLTGRTRTVTTELGGVRAKHVVMATGMPILDRGGWFARMEPQRSYVVALRGREQPAEMALRIGGATRSSRAAQTADGDAVLLVAGADHPVGKGGDTRRHPAALETWGRLRFSAGGLVATWSAQDWHPADRLPLAGPLLPGDGRVMAAGGFAKWGLTSGTAAAATLRRRLLGEPLTDVDRLLDPARLPPLQDVRALASINARVGWSMANGWLRALRPRRGRPEEGHGQVVRHGHRPVAEATVGGRTHRCQAVCTHLGGIVEWDAQARTWACPLHGSRFAHDGRILAGPASQRLAPVADDRR